MAKFNNKTTTLFVMIFSLLLIMTIVESRPVLRIGFVKAKSAPVCDSVFGVRSGDTCFDIAQNNNLSTAEFDAVNPNLNCSTLFVGQWLCVNGTA